jgi:hypothetical protein
MLAFKSLRLLFVKSLALVRYSIIFKGDTATCLKHKDVVFKAYIRQRTYIIKKGKSFFTNKGKNSNSLNLD